MENRCWRVAICGLAGTIFLVGAARADDDRVSDTPMVVTARTVTAREPQLDDELFNLWFFGGRSDRFQQQLSEELQRNVSVYKVIDKLSEADEVKLMLAGEGDVRRLMDRANLLRSRFHMTRGNAKELLVIHREAVRLREQALSNLFAESSLFAKVAETIRTRQSEEHRPASEFSPLRSAAEQEMARLGRFVELRPEQNSALVELLVLASPVDCDFSDEWTIRHVLAEIPDDRLRQLLTGEQWARLRPIRDGYLSHLTVRRRSESVREVRREQDVSDALTQPNGGAK